MAVVGIVLVTVGIALVVAAVVVLRAGRPRAVRRVVVTGQIVRQVGLGRTPLYEVAYPLPDGSWATTTTRAPLSPGGIATLGWRQGTPVPVHVNVDDPRDARLTPDGAPGAAWLVGIILCVIGGAMLLAGTLLALAAAAT